MCLQFIFMIQNNEKILKKYWKSTSLRFILCKATSPWKQELLFCNLHVYVFPSRQLALLYTRVTFDTLKYEKRKTSYSVEEFKFSNGIKERVVGMHSSLPFVRLGLIWIQLSLVRWAVFSVKLSFVLDVTMVSISYSVQFGSLGT